MNVTWLLLFPLLTLAGILLVPRAAAAKWIALCGSLVQLIVSGWLYRAYSAEVSNENVILFQQQRPLFPSLGIQIHFGVDGIAVAICVSSFHVGPHPSRLLYRNL